MIRSRKNNLQSKFYKKVAVKALMNRRHGRDHHTSKFQGEDGAACIVRHDLPAGLWELAFHEGGQETAR